MNGDYAFIESNLGQRFGQRIWDF